MIDWFENETSKSRLELYQFFASVEKSNDNQRQSWTLVEWMKRKWNLLTPFYSRLKTKQIHKEENKDNKFDFDIKTLLYILSIIFTLFVLTASFIRLVVVLFTFRLTFVYWLLHRKYPRQSKQRPTTMLNAEIQYWIFGRILTIKLTVLTITGVIFSSFWKKIE